MLAEYSNKENETLMASLLADNMTQWKYTDRLFGRPLTNIPVPLIKRQGMLECDLLNDRRSAVSWACPKSLMTTSSPISVILLSYIALQLTLHTAPIGIDLLDTPPRHLRKLSILAMGNWKGCIGPRGLCCPPKWCTSQLTA